MGEMHPIVALSASSPSGSSQQWGIGGFKSQPAATASASSKATAVHCIAAILVASPARNAGSGTQLSAEPASTSICKPRPIRTLRMSPHRSVGASPSRLPYLSRELAARAILDVRKIREASNDGVTAGRIPMPSHRGPIRTASETGLHQSYAAQHDDSDRD